MYMSVGDECVGGSSITEKVDLKLVVVSVPFFTVMKTLVSSKCSSLLTSLTS